MGTYDTLHRSETLSFWYKHCWWWKEKEKTWWIQELWVCLYMLSQKTLNVMWWCNICDKELYLDNPNVADALSRRYREVRNKEFICKPYHTKLQHGHLSRVNSNDVEHSKNVVVMNSNDMTQSMKLQWHHQISHRILNTQIIAYVHVAINLIYQGFNASYSRHQGTILIIL